MDTAVSMSDEGKGLGEEGGDKKQQPTERWSITGGFKVLSTYFHRPSPASSSLSFARLVSPGAAVRELRLARGLLASLAPVVDCLYELPSICVFHGGDRYDCDRGESGGTLIQQRIDRFRIRRDFSLPGLTGLTRYAYSRADTYAFAVIIL